MTSACLVMTACSSGDTPSTGPSPATEGGAGVEGSGSLPGNPGGSTTSPSGDGGSAAGPDASPPAAICDPKLTPVDTRAPTTVVGTGSAASCTEAALSAAVAKGGIITFACGGPLTLTLTRTLALRTDVATTLDGGNTVTLDGGDAVRILSFDHHDFRKNDVVLTLQHLTLTRGRSKGTDLYAKAAAPCSQGFYDGQGGALYVSDGVLVAIDVTFTENHAAALGPDTGGGAIYVTGSKRAVVSGCTFRGNQGSNGGAIGSLNSELDVWNSTFDGNVAQGNGANGNDQSQCAVLAKTNQHQTGSGGNGGAVAIDGGSDGTHTFCGNRFTNNTSGQAALGGAIFRTPDGDKETTVIDRCLFGENHGDSGSSLYFHNSTLQVTSSTFAGNTGKGPGVQADGTTLHATNVTFASNVATAGLGAGIALFGGDGTIESCTFSGNQAEGGDPYFAAALFGGSTLTIDDTLFVNNTAKNAGAPMQCQVTATGHGNLQWPRTHTVGGSNDTPCVAGITFADPQLGPLGDHGGPVPTLLPAAGSPALEAGTGCPATDARGIPRTTNKCTSGAAEGT